MSGADLLLHTFADNADHPIAHADASIGGVAWSPDGRNLALARGRLISDMVLIQDTR